MKKLIILLFPLLLYAAGGDTLRFSTSVRTLADGDTFYSDVYYHPLKDSIQRVINGKLGNVNLAATAQIAWTKMDTTGTSVSKKARGDTCDYRIAILDSVYDIDTLFGTVLKCNRFRPDTLFGTYGDFALFDTVRATYGDFTLQDTLKSNVIRGDSLTYIGNDTTRFKITKSGNVGIGTGTPDVFLHLVAPVVQLMFEETGVSPNNKKWDFLAYGETFYGRALNDVLADNNWLVINRTGTVIDNINFSAGSVGIDTASPGSKLHVAGSIRARDTSFAGVGYFTGNVGLYKNQDAGTILRVSNTNSNAAAYSLIYAETDQAESIALYAHSTTFATAGLADHGTLLTDLPGGLNITANTANGDIRFFTGSGGSGVDADNLRMTIMKSNSTTPGFVGIDTTTPDKKLTVKGSIRATDTVFALVYVDLTPGYKDGALKDLRKIKNDRNGNIDHKTLPKYAKASWEINTGNKLIDKTKTVEGRDIGAMVSILTKAVQELADKVDSLELELKRRGTR